jgi:hypothetical protein
MIIEKGGSWWIKKGGIGRSITRGPYRWKWVAIVMWPIV